MHCSCLVTQLCPTLCDSMDYSPAGSSVRGFSRQEYWSGLLFPSPGDLPEWVISLTEEPGGLQAIRSQRVRHDRSDLACMHIISRWKDVNIISHQENCKLKPWRERYRFIFTKIIQKNHQLWWECCCCCLVHQSCQRLCDSMDCSVPGFPAPHYLPEFAQTHVHWVSDALQPSHPLWSPSPPAFNLSQHQSLFQWVSSSHEVAKVLEFQL